MEKYKLIKLDKINFVDKGVCGDAYREKGVKYYSIVCSFETAEKVHYHKFENIYLLLTEVELNRLLNELFFYDINDKKIIFIN